MKFTLENVGKNVRALRKGKKMSQEKLANLCGHTTSSARSWTSYFERGKSDIGIDELGKISKALKVSPAVLFVDFEESDDEKLYCRLVEYNKLIASAFEEDL